MYATARFQIDRAACLSFAQARGFGLFCAHDGARPLASPLPFHLGYRGDGTPQVLFHVARGNALAALADGTSSWLAAVTGADAYVSPDWYVSPHQVPTWLYQAVHLSGPVQPMSSTELFVHLDQLGETFETRLAPKPVWRLSKMPPGRLQAMAQAIVGLVMTVEHVEGSFKLNQHKSDADHVAVTQALALQKEASAQEISRHMQAMRPGAFAPAGNDSILATQKGISQ